MWNLLTRRADECKLIQDLLEDAATNDPQAATVEELLEALPAVQRAHISACRDCRDSAQELLAARELLSAIIPSAEESRPWFATRVMAAIAAKERELSEVRKTWLAVPKFASRVAVASAALLLVASTWLYERPVPEPLSQSASLASQESLFESPGQAVNQDDVLLNRVERNP